MSLPTASPPAPSDEPPPPLPPEDRRELLRIARVALKTWLRTGHLPPGAPHRRSLLAHRPCAVALHDERGPVAAACHLEGDRALYLAVEALVAACAAQLPVAPRPEDIIHYRIEIALVDRGATVPASHTRTHPNWSAGQIIAAADPDSPLPVDTFIDPPPA